MNSILVIDHDVSSLAQIREALREIDAEVRVTLSAEDGVAELKSRHSGTVIISTELPDISGLELVEKLLSLDPLQQVILISASDDCAIAIEAMKLGAADILTMPLDVDHFQASVKRSIAMRESLVSSPAHTRRSPVASYATKQMIGSSSLMQEVYKDIGRVASQDIPVLISGENGSGKELTARTLHQHSTRCNEPFVAVNCGMLSDASTDEELLLQLAGGDTCRDGRSEIHRSRTVFLDEIGDISLVLQSKLVRLLTEPRFRRGDSPEAARSNTRIISATSRDPQQMIDVGLFRSDLYHCLNGYRIALPPLRHRKEDIQQLLDYFMNRASVEHRKSILGLSVDARQMLVSYQWPGNVREMEAVVRRAVLKASGPVILLDTVADEIRMKSVSEVCDGNMETRRLADRVDADDDNWNLVSIIDQRLSRDSKNLYAEVVELMEHCLISRVLRKSDGNQSRAAAELGISRGSLRNKIRALGISIEHVVQSVATTN